MASAKSSPTRVLAPSGLVSRDISAIKFAHGLSIQICIANKTLSPGVGPTFAGYFLQGALKFGGYEFFKQQWINQLGYETASNNRTAVYLASSAAGEFFADIALCPLEATRIRLVSEPTYANGLISGFTKMLKNEGVGAFYAGFGPILFKQ